MAVTVQTYHPTLVAGQVYLKRAGAAEPRQAIGNVSQLELVIDEDDKGLGDFTRPGGGQWAAISRVKGINAAMKLHDLDPVNMARAIYGDSRAAEAGTVTDEAHTAYKGGLIRLVHPAPTAITVTSDPAGTTYAADTDYEVRQEGLMILPDGAITDGAKLLVDYSYGAYSVVEALTGGSQIYELSFGGMNEARLNSPVILDIFRIKFGAAKALSFIGDDFAALEVAGKVLMDPTKSGAGRSNYFRVTMV